MLFFDVGLFTTLYSHFTSCLVVTATTITRSTSQSYALFYIPEAIFMIVVKIPIPYFEGINEF